MPDMNLPIQRGDPFFQTDTPWGIARMASHLGFRYGAGDVYYVGSTAVNAAAVDTGNRGIDPMTPFASIQAGLDACVDGHGDTVIVFPGHWDITTALSMTKDGVRLVSWDYLRGQPAPSSVIDANGNCHCLEINADEIEVAGFRFANSDNNSYSCIRVASTVDTIGAYIHDCLFAVGLYGIYFGVTTEWAQDVMVEECTFMLMDAEAADAGIFMNKLTRAIIQHNYFWSNQAGAGYGIAVANASQPGVMVRENDFLFQVAGTCCYRAGTTVDVSFHRNFFSGAGTPITILIDGGDHAVDNYSATDAGGALVDATT